MDPTLHGTHDALPGLVQLAARLLDAPLALLVLPDVTLCWPPGADAGALAPIAEAVAHAGDEQVGAAVGVPVPGGGALCVLAPAHDLVGLRTVAAAVGGARDLAASRRAAARAQSRLDRLAAVAMELGAVDSLERLTEVVVGRGLPVLGVDGGAVIVREDDRFRLVVGADLGADVQRRYGDLPVDSPLPAALVARTGTPLVLADRAAGAAFDGPLMEQVYADTGCLSWAFAPLVVGGELLGSLAVGWHEERTAIPPDELELVDAFAAQCAAAVARVRTLRRDGERRVHEQQRRRRDAEAQQAESAALALLASGAPVAEVLPALTHWVEQTLLDTRCTLTLVPPGDGVRVRLPSEQRRPLGQPVPCCTGGTDRRCWAFPVASPASGDLLGTLVLHRRGPALPGEDVRSLVGRACHLVGIAVDRQELLARLDHQARHDAATGLANRRQLLEVLEARLERGDRPLVAFLDLDGLKTVNDTLGHAAGDALLLDVAQRLQAVSRPGDLVARFGGDEFVVLAAVGADAAEPLAARLLTAVSAADGAGPRASIGVVVAEPGQRAADLLRAADAAMYHAKSAGGGRCVLAGRLLEPAAQRP